MDNQMGNQIGSQSDFMKLGTLGGKIKVNRGNLWMYATGEQTPAMKKENLFGIKGSLHPGMPHTKGEMAEASLSSDTKKDFVKELIDKGLTREEAVSTIKDLLKSGTLKEVMDPDLGEKVLVLENG